MISLYYVFRQLSPRLEGVGGMRRQWSSVDHFLSIQAPPPAWSHASRYPSDWGLPRLSPPPPPAPPRVVSCPRGGGGDQEPEYSQIPSLPWPGLHSLGLDTDHHYESLPSLAPLHFSRTGAASCFW